MPSKKAKNKTRKLGKCLVTGGAGFLGRNIAKKLLSQGNEVVVFDRQEFEFFHPNLEIIRADLLDVEKLNKACEGIDCVFHTASIIELGTNKAPEEYRNRSLIVNAKGTQRIVDACINQGVKRLVYTSSNVVCFNGTPISGMNSDTPYATNVYDMYTESKIAAEKIVLANNGENGLLTCALRPSGIYGPESNVMLDRLVEQCVAEKVVAGLGNPNAVHDNSFIDNLVHAQILAAERLVKGNRCCGRGYFISDHEPMHNFDLFRPIIEGLGYKFPKVWIPMAPLMIASKALQWLHFKYATPRPFVFPKELEKACVTHISDISEPIRDLDYKPLYTVNEAIQMCMPYCLELQQKLRNTNSEIPEGDHPMKVMFVLWPKENYSLTERREKILSLFGNEIDLKDIDDLRVNIDDEYSTVKSPAPKFHSGASIVATVSIKSEKANFEDIRIILENAGFTVGQYEVEEHPYRDYGENEHFAERDWPDGVKTPSVVVAVTLLTKPKKFSHQEWMKRWFGKMSPGSEAIQPRARYIRNVVSKVGVTTLKFDGIVEESWPSSEHISDPYKFYLANNTLELIGNMIKMVRLVTHFHQLHKIRTVTMSEYFLKTDFKNSEEKNQALESV